MPLIIINVQRGGPSTGLPTNVEQSDLNQAIFGGHGDSPRVVLAPESVEDCFYIAIEAARIAKKYSTPVFILSDASIATRIEAFEMPELDKVMLTNTIDLTPREDHKPYPLDAITQHIAPGTRVKNGNYPLITGLEHDEMGHPTGSPKLHVAMTAKRRDKFKTLAAEIPVPKVYGAPEGNILLVGWGSTAGPIREAVDKARAAGDSISALHLRHIHPLPNGLETIFDGFNHVLVVEMNDEGFYGYGQLGGILRARYADPKIQSITKVDGLTYKVRDILDRTQSKLNDALVKR
jgi:2-oxoglutarate ferredoxin oxidoreductase subunit alpha